MSDSYQGLYQGNVEFAKSKTRENLMRAFAGESQARNRYTFAAGQARREGLALIAQVFEFTADQERAHAKVFYDLLKPLAGTNLTVAGMYPVDQPADTLSSLKVAQHNEYQEWEHDYAEFSRIAYEEGFQVIGKVFEMVADVEKTHGDRFGHFAEQMEENKLFFNGEETVWICLNCGQITHLSLIHI